MSSAIRFNLDQSKILSSGNGLNRRGNPALNSTQDDKIEALSTAFANNKSNVTQTFNTSVIGEKHYTNCCKICISQGKIMPLSKLKVFAANKFSVSKNISVFDRVETLWVKEKILVTSILAFSHYFFKRLLSQGC